MTIKPYPRIQHHHRAPLHQRGRTELPGRHRNVALGILRKASRLGEPTHYRAARGGNVPPDLRAFSRSGRDRDPVHPHLSQPERHGQHRTPGCATNGHRAGDGARFPATEPGDGLSGPGSSPGRCRQPRDGRDRRLAGRTDTAHPRLCCARHPGVYAAQRPGEEISIWRGQPAQHQAHTQNAQRRTEKRSPHPPAHH